MESVDKSKLKKLKWLWIAVVILGILYILPEVEEPKEEAKETTKEVVKVKETKPLSFEDQLKVDIEKKLGKSNNQGKNYVESIAIENGLLSIKVNPNKGISVSNMINSMNSDATKILSLMKGKSDHDTVHLQMLGAIVDKLGNEKTVPLLDVRVKKDTLEAINFDNFKPGNLKEVVEAYGLDASLR